MKAAVLDYGVGNLASVVQGLKHVGFDPVITRREKDILSAQAVILPGVGAFPQGMEKLQKYELVDVIKEVCSRGTPFLGICLGMQLLFEESQEFGVHEGLGLLSGKVSRFPQGLKVPHMGWNTLKIARSHLLFENIDQESYVYFVHSYYVNKCDPSHILASSDYGVEFPVIVCFNNIIGIQFHPEKSSRVGLKILSNFGEMVRKC